MMHLTRPDVTAILAFRAADKAHIAGVGICAITQHAVEAVEHRGMSVGMAVSKAYSLSAKLVAQQERPIPPTQRIRTRGY